MSFATHLNTLLRKELLLEFKHRSSLAGLLLYVCSTVFLVYLVFDQSITIKAYNALLWVIVLFTGVNSTSKGFLGEPQGERLYYYQLVPPVQFILSKAIYYSILLAVLSCLSLFVFALLFGFPFSDPALLICALVVGSIAIGSILSLISAIAAKSGNNPTLVAILGFPILLPLLLTIIKVSGLGMEGRSISENLGLLGALAGFEVITLSLGFLLFPYLWRD